ncbi:hypothetical protein [Thalassoglobus polymorphus]|uniref:Uncharacterized protein n=1 Tax=Thalassoglobus polymorphus TaxID=2527994 RepID=A0A517QTE0_9PLAN|nr:hypothetical protein [Thalassoglobus polymorphus]QDT34915.1 hypothetical protein Mal48_41880 [Thalassoglobus polymorphus]
MRIKEKLVRDHKERGSLPISAGERFASDNRPEGPLSTSIVSRQRQFAVEIDNHHYHEKTFIETD